MKYIKEMIKYFKTMNPIEITHAIIGASAGLMILLLVFGIIVRVIFTVVLVYKLVK